jgi:Helix-turn-helix
MLRLIQPADFRRSPCLGLRRLQTTLWHPQPGRCNRPSRQPGYGQTRPCRPRRELNKIITFGRIKPLHRPHHHVRLTINNCVGVQPSSKSSCPARKLAVVVRTKKAKKKVSPRATTAVDAYVGSRMRDARAALGISQEELGKKLGISFQQVQK